MFEICTVPLRTVVRYGRSALWVRAPLLQAVHQSIVFTVLCTIAQSVVLRSHVVCLSVCLSVCLWRWWTIST